MPYNKKYIRLLLIFLAFLPVMLLRDFTADNELKYLSIADEAIRNGHFFTFFNHGIAYADKPPLYIWIIMIGKLVFGRHLMFFLSLFSLLPAMATVMIMDKFTRKILSDREQAAAEIVTFGTLYFMASAFVARMDMLMTMFIVLSFYTFYKMYESFKNCGKIKKTDGFLLPAFIFLGLFTKGPIGIILPVVAIIVFLISKKEAKLITKFLGFRTWTVLAALCAIWFACVYFEGGKSYLNNLLFNQTVNRAIEASEHRKPFYFYFVSYWFTVAPWSPAVAICIIEGIRRKAFGGNVMRLFAAVSLSLFIMLSAFSSKLEIYLLPCFPFLIYMSIIIIKNNEKSPLIKWSVAIPAIIFVISSAAAFFWKSLSIKCGIPQIMASIAVPALFILAAGGIAGLVFLGRGHVIKAMEYISIAIILMLFTGSLSINKFNNMIGMKKGCEKAMQLGRKLGTERYAYYDFAAGGNFDVYFRENYDELLAKGKSPLSKEEIKDFALINIKKGSLGFDMPTILFVKNRDIKKDKGLKKFYDENEHYIFGEYCVIGIK
ncbi:MAG: glycosyltransferase family 39 protein [Bacteroidales bacterium]|jgi:4-amino-4-deoxy-L-arabinose transferase-like glycosyltransferase|nr:glycosyltransferase family 39 protein [Bacteroidales bacterium]